jgi:hypothetical protein
VLSALVFAGVLQGATPFVTGHGPLLGEDDLRPLPALEPGRGLGRSIDVELRDPFVDRRAARQAPGDGVELRALPAASQTNAKRMHLLELRDPFDVEKAPTRISPPAATRRIQLGELRDPFNR